MWTKEKNVQVSELWIAGVPYGKILKIMGITPGALSWKVRALALPTRRDPNYKKKAKIYRWKKPEREKLCGCDWCYGINTAEVCQG